jgi:predicted DCC family thiol-disulfide oxidoreductase YuxK
VLLYDGACGLCAEAVQIILRDDRRGLLRFAPLDGEFAAGVRRRHALEAADSIVWVEPAHGQRAERVFIRSDAALRVAGYLGGVWRTALVGWLLPRPLRDALYDVVARHRHNLISRAERCLVPSPDARARFLL